ncbi:MAG: recombinase family protein [Tissierellia bacterium]|nr:recombinase family protein [Tissierellia bacterium]
MARTSRRYEVVKKSSPIKKDKRFQAGIYTRLSVDRKYSKTRDLSDSINGQIAIAEDYVSKNEDITIREVYTDYEFSGTDFNRPAFEKMMGDIKRKHINCVIVKDLSRFGREYLEVGNYIETIFPFLGVRFISVNDRFDTEKEMSSGKSMEVTIKNIINDMYAKDISLKLKSSLREKAKNGYFTGSNPPYGYQTVKDKGGYRLVVDPVSAPILKEIFKYALADMSFGEIAVKLNERKIASPRLYNRNKELFSSGDKGGWTGSTIHIILVNEVYLGHMVQGKTSKCIAKNMKRTDIPKNEQIVVRNTHEALVSQEDFDIVQRKLVSKPKITKSKGHKKSNKYENLLFCGHCGRELYMSAKAERKVNGVPTYHSYICYRYTYGLKEPCRNRIFEDELDEIVIKTINHVISYTKVNADNIRKNSIEYLQIKLNQLKEEQTKILREIKMNEESYRMEYENYVKGHIDREQFMLFREQYNTDMQVLTLRQRNIESSIEERKISLQLRKKTLDEIIKSKRIVDLDQQTLRNFVERITLYRRKQVEINLNFTSIFEDKEVSL